MGAFNISGGLPLPMVTYTSLPNSVKICGGARATDQKTKFPFTTPICTKFVGECGNGKNHGHFDTDMAI